MLSKYSLCLLSAFLLQYDALAAQEVLASQTGMFFRDMRGGALRTPLEYMQTTCT